MENMLNRKETWTNFQIFINLWLILIIYLDFRRWIIEANEEISLENFKTSPYWIFKKIYKIITRKI